MSIRTYTLNEAARESSLPLEQLEKLLALGVVKPAAVTEDSQPLFDASSLKELAKIKGLVDLGYELEEIGKISRKVGIPAGSGSKRKTGRLLTVGELARRAQLNVRTIKYWEEQEILTPEAYSEGGFRLFSEDYVLFCQLIRDLQLFNYSLKEIKEAADLFRAYSAYASGAQDATSPEAILSFSSMLSHIDELRDRMAQLQTGVKRWQGFTDKYARQISKLKSHAKKYQGQVEKEQKRNLVAEPAEDIPS